ncbi:uncharacterized protein FFB14_11786 [Fusarium fujikuroi]|nr:uncharacterized protein FFB14_11786 [Fusarium fujikuroi]
MRLRVHNQVQSRITQMHNRPLTSKITKNALSYERFMQGTRAAARLTPAIMWRPGTKASQRTSWNSSTLTRPSPEEESK